MHAHQDGWRTGFKVPLNAERHGFIFQHALLQALIPIRGFFIRSNIVHFGRCNLPGNETLHRLQKWILADWGQNFEGTAGISHEPSNLRTFLRLLPTSFLKRAKTVDPGGAGRPPPSGCLLQKLRPGLSSHGHREPRIVHASFNSSPLFLRHTNQNRFRMRLSTLRSLSVSPLHAYVARWDQPQGFLLIRQPDVCTKY